MITASDPPRQVELRASRRITTVCGAHRELAQRAETFASPSITLLV